MLPALSSLLTLDSTSAAAVSRMSDLHSDAARHRLDAAPRRHRRAARAANSVPDATRGSSAR